MTNAEKILNEYFQEKYTLSSSDTDDEFKDSLLYPVDLNEPLVPKLMVLEMIEKAFKFGTLKQKEASAEVAYSLSSKIIAELWQGNKDGTTFTWADRRDMAEEIKQATLNAEVKL